MFVYVKQRIQESIKAAKGKEQLAQPSCARDKCLFPLKGYQPLPPKNNEGKKSFFPFVPFFVYLKQDPFLGEGWYPFKGNKHLSRISSWFYVFKQEIKGKILMAWQEACEPFIFVFLSMHRIGKSILFKINDFNTMWFFHLLLCTAQWVHIGYFFGTDLYFKKSNVCIGLCLGQHLKQPNPAKVWKD